MYWIWTKVYTCKVKTKVQKWGNSLAIRIPKTIALETNLTEGSQVQISSEKGQIVIEPEGKGYALKKLLAKIKPDNLHGETETGDALGNEVW